MLLTRLAARSLAMALASALALVFGGACSGSAPVPTATVPTATVPTPTPVPSALEWPQRVRYGDDPAQIGWLRVPTDAPPQGGFPVAVLVHGGFWAEPWDYTLMEDLAVGLTDAGFVTWNIEFRRLGGRGGWPTTFDDVRLAIDELTTIAVDQSLDLDQVVTVGHSSGGHLALWAARDDVVTKPRVHHAVGLAAITDLRLATASIGLLGGTPSEVPDRWAAAAPSLNPAAVTLVHGTADDDVPLAAVENAAEAGVAIDVVDGADHFALLTPGTAGYDRVLAVVADVVISS